MISIFVHKTSGKLGSSIAKLIDTDPAYKLGSLEQCDVVIDVSDALAIEGLLESCIVHKKPLIIGTTGYSKATKDLLIKASDTIPIMLCANFSLGIALLKNFISQMEGYLDESHIDIIETHHHLKKDKPSGTALELKELAPNSTIHSIRAQKSLGQHEIIFSFEDEKITFKHETLSRLAYAKGAIRSAKFLSEKTKGLYSLKDIL